MVIYSVALAGSPSVEDILTFFLGMALGSSDLTGDRESYKTSLSSIAAETQAASVSAVAAIWSVCLLISEVAEIGLNSLDF